MLSVVATVHSDCFWVSQFYELSDVGAYIPALMMLNTFRCTSHQLRGPIHGFTVRFVSTMDAGGFFLTDAEAATLVEATHVMLESCTCSILFLEISENLVCVLLCKCVRFVHTA